MMCYGRYGTRFDGELRLAQGPLGDVKVVEFAGLGPAPFCGMLLADLGADVVRIDRKDAKAAAPHQVTHRGRKSVALDLKNKDAVELCLQMFERAEIVFEGFRPGVMERLGLGPDVALKRNPKLVYGRMTGWGQTGPLAQAAGHDINYIAITGALHAIGTIVGASVIAGGAVMRMLTVVSQPFWSEIVTSMMPAHRSLAMNVLSPVEGSGVQSIVYWPLPPVGEMTASPSQSPAQVTGVIVAFGWIGVNGGTVNDSIVSQPSESVTVNV